MTLDDTLRLLLTAVQPHMHKDEPDQGEVEHAVRAVKQMFAEEPNAEAAFVAAVQALVAKAREGWTRDV